MWEQACSRIPSFASKLAPSALVKLARPIAGSAHPYKYRLFYGYTGERVIGYDNERPKGDHRHYRQRESAYTFVSPGRLIDDFLADVALERSRS